jgi:hypothetical protein
VVAQNAERGVLANQVATGVRIGSITDGVTKANQLVHARHGEAVQDRFQGLKVGVGIREKTDPHTGALVYCGSSLGGNLDDWQRG